MTIKEFTGKINSGLNPEENAKQVIESLKEINNTIHCMNVIDENAKPSAKGLLTGFPITVKDCICVKDMESTAGSAILNNYFPVFDATVISKLRKEGAIILGKTSQDAFGFGTFNVNVGNNKTIPKNPNDTTRACGGSSGGSAAITKAASFPHVSIAESTGGSIVCPASFCGIYGLCPTYGRVSRYGLMDYANSLDKIGPMATNAEDLAIIMNIIAGEDPLDSTSLSDSVPDYTASLKKGAQNLKVGVLTTSFKEGIDPKIQEATKECVEKLKQIGATVEEIDLPLAEEYGIPAYYLISMSEASTNLAKYCGLRYGATEELKGNFNEYFTNVRSTHLNAESKRRIILGTFARMAGYRDAYYIKAMKVRTKIIEEYKEAFKKYDLLLSPTMPILPPTFDEIKKLSPLQQYTMDVLTVAPNLAGLPHINIPFIEKDKLPVGMLFTANHLKEEVLIQIAGALK